MSCRLSVDIGGTFTDVALEHAGGLTTTKVLTTYADPALGVMQGIDEILLSSRVEVAQIALVVHGTTLATNALIERSGARTGLLTTEGHRDVLEMAFENRFEQYDVNIDRPQPLVPRRWRRGVSERIAADGSVLRALDTEQVLAVVAELVDQGVTALAIGFLHSYANPAHELQAEALIHAAYPQLVISRSSAVCPEIREYERLSTTVANTYVKPLMARYLTSLDERLQARGINCQMLLMTSGGGLTTLDAAREFPIRLVESGPAGGAMLAAHIGQTLGLAQVLSFDMGGTTAKICLIDEGTPLYSRAFEVDRSYRFKRGSGLPVRIPVIEMVEIGAGGGSIASVDNLSRIRVGPESAGSEPGPACYGRGGTAPTVSDADTVLGKLSGAWFADGKLAFDAAASAAAVTQGVAKFLNLDVTDAAHAIAEVVEENMASASRAHAAEWGRSLEGRTLIAFGGAAPLHAAALAQKLKISDVLVPGGAGVGSALGFLLAPVRFEVVRSDYTRLGSLDVPRVEGLLQEMRAEAQAVVVGAAPNCEYLEHRQAFMRYVGQGYEVAVEVKSGPLDTSMLRVDFDSAYRGLYGRTIPGMEIEILSWTLAVTAATELASVSMIHAQRLSQPPPVSGSLWNDQAMTEAAIVPRAALETHKVYCGPMLIVEPQTTTVVPESFDAVVLGDGTLRLTQRRKVEMSNA